MECRGLGEPCEKFYATQKQKPPTIEKIVYTAPAVDQASGTHRAYEHTNVTATCQCPTCVGAREAEFNEHRPKEHKFTSGAVRSTDGNDTRYDLISPIALRRLAATYAEGEKKYGPGNWLKGIPQSNLFNHLMRHLLMYQAGDRSEDHLGHALWNLVTLTHFDETRPDLHDLTPNVTEKKHAKAD